MRMAGVRTRSPGCRTKCVLFMPAVTVRTLAFAGFVKFATHCPVQPTPKTSPLFAAVQLPMQTLKNGNVPSEERPGGHVPSSAAAVSPSHSIVTRPAEAFHGQQSVVVGERMSEEWPAFEQFVKLSEPAEASGRPVGQRMQPATGPMSDNRGSKSVTPCDAFDPAACSTVKAGG